MADHEHRDGAGLQRVERVGQPGDGLDVEVVRRLVEHQQVVVAEQQLGQRDAATLPAGEGGELGVEVDVGQQVLDDRAGAGVGGPDVVGLAVDDDRADGGAGRDVVGLDAGSRSTPARSA